LLTCRDASLAEVIQVDTGSGVPAVEAVEVIHDETASGNIAPLRGDTAGHLVSAGVKTRLQRRVFRTQSCPIRGRVRVVLPADRAPDAIVNLTTHQLN